MKVIVCLVILLVLQVKLSKCWVEKLIFQQQGYKEYQDFSDEYKDVDPGNPLLLTPLIESNKVNEARQAAEVSHPEFFGVRSYAGFLTVDKVFASNLFIWFFPAEQDYDNAPVILWLQGGPGDSSLGGLFYENGPFQIESINKTTLRDYRWTKEHSVLYIDNPVGTGFSYTSNGFSKNQTHVGENLYEALQQFYKLFPELQKNDFYAAGESYAGKYVPAIAYKIDQENPAANIKINLKGIAIDSGLTDPIHQINYADYLYQTGMIDANASEEMKKLEQVLVTSINNQEWGKAYNDCIAILSLYVNKVQIYHLYSYMDYEYLPNQLKQFAAAYVTRNDIRKAIHVGNLTYESTYVYGNLTENLMQSVAPWISHLLSKYRGLIYNGQVDVIVGYPLTLNYLQHLNFSGADEYKAAARKIWRVGGDVAGYVKVAGKLTEAMVRKAGHVLVHDQPEWAYDLIYKFIRNTPIA